MTPQLLKAALTKALNDLLAPIQAEFQASKEWQEVTELAYPPEKKPEKANKPKKEKGGDPAKFAAAQAAKAAKLAAQAQASAVDSASQGVETLKVDSSA